MEGCCSPRCMAGKLIAVGIIVILVRWLLPAWDIWIVLGVLALIKGIFMMIKPVCPCQCETKPVKKR